LQLGVYPVSGVASGEKEDLCKASLSDPAQHIFAKLLAVFL
jgi:hypothetical protein